MAETEQDANSALTELDKGLRSGKVGEQCEAIVRFPRLFEKYPFPILINSSFLKLSDVFRVGNNFLRLCVLRVCQQSEKHLDKILNVNEFVKRIFSVLHSNDPVARSLTLQTLGSIAGVIPERQQVHHIIRRSLDSHDSVEVEAAIYAARQFAAQSKTFALGMCDKISDMIRGIATPAHMKLLLIPIFQYMHHDTSAASMVRVVCTDLLPKYPANDFVVTTLNTLTKLAASTLVDIPSQVELLLQYLVSNNSESVKEASLLGLRQLAKIGPHLWPTECVAQTITVARTSSDQNVIMLVLDILIVLTQSSVICKQYVNPDSELMKLCQETCYSSHSMISAKSVKIITHTVKFCFEEGLPISDVEEHISTVESLLLLLVSCREKQEVGYHVLKICLQCALTLCKVHKPLANRFIDLFATQLIYTRDEASLMLCEALGGLGELEPQALNEYLPILLEKVLSIDNKDEIQTGITVMICTLIFQTVRPVKWESKLQASMLSIIDRIDLWSRYKVARAAARYGHYKVCIQIVSDLKNEVATEQYHFWLIGLEYISRSEIELVDFAKPLTERLGEAITLYEPAISALRAGSNPSHGLQFQIEYVTIRCELLRCFLQLVTSCNSLCFSPPPAIAAAIVTASRDDLFKCGHITNQLRKCAKEFKACGEMFWKLYQTAFDADPISLSNIQVLQHICAVVAYSIESIAYSNHQDEKPKFSIANHSLEVFLMSQACNNALDLNPMLQQKKTVITHKDVESLKEQVQILCNAPFCLPRYFFQLLQTTSIKLAVTPQPRVPGEYIPLTAGTQLAVKVEGVIIHGKKPGLFRTVDKVTVNLTTQHSTQKIGSEKTQETNLNLTQTVIPHRDFFSVQFLVSLGLGSVQASVVITASIVDETGAVWQTRPKSTLLLKQHDEHMGRSH